MKHINKGRRPTMHHVLRTHRADLDWQCDRVNLDPRSQIKYVNTTQQLADILTKYSCTADRWTPDAIREHHGPHQIYSQ